MSKIIDEYKKSFDELNILLSASLADSTTGQEVVNAVGDFLIGKYASATLVTEDTLDEQHEIQLSAMYDTVFKEIADMTFEERIADYYELGDYEAIRMVAETELHRDFNSAIQHAAENSNKEVYKKWVTMGDERVRDTHFYLEGATIPIKDKFVTIGGDSAYYPGDFDDASNNINCRCVIDILNR